MYRVVAGTQSLGLGLSASRDLGPVPQGAAPAAAGSSTTAGSSTSAPAASGAGNLPPVRQSFRAEPNGHCRDYSLSLSLSYSLFIYSRRLFLLYVCILSLACPLGEGIFFYLPMFSNGGMARLLLDLTSVRILFAFLFR